MRDNIDVNKYTVNRKTHQHVFVVSFKNPTNFDKIRYILS